MKLTFYTNGLVGTGYGTQAKQMIPRLQRSGWQVAMAVNYGHSGFILEHAGIDGGDPFPMFPTGIDAYSNDVVAAHHAAHTKGGQEPGGILTLYDAWPLVPQEFTKNGTQVAAWTPIDHVVVPKGCLPFLTHPDVLPIAMSRFGQAQMKAAGVDARYAPHGIDRAIHRPGQTLANGVDARRALQIPADAFVVTMNAANKGSFPPRKAWSENLQALAIFMRAHPDVYAYLHTFKSGVNGVDLNALAAAVGLPPERVRWADQYAYVTGLIRDVDVAALHEAGDVHLAVSMGEGFGLSVPENLSVARASIVSDFAASPEIVGDTGFKVQGQLWWDHAQTAWFFMPYVPSIVDALEQAYAERGTQAALDRQAACLARSAEYDADAVFSTYWLPILAELRERVERKHLSRKPVNTAIRPKGKKKRAA